MRLSLHRLVIAIAASLPLCVNGAGRPCSDYSYDPDAVAEDGTNLGPNYWGGLCIEEDACDGNAQSPINIASRECDAFADYKYEWKDCPAERFFINNHVGEVEYSEKECDSRLVLPHVPGSFVPLQFHVHLSSEHTLDDFHFGAEVHIVHASAEPESEDLAVLGVFINPGNLNDNPLFDTILERWELWQRRVKRCCRRAGGVGAVCEDERLTGRRLTETEEENEVDAETEEENEFDAYELIPEGTKWYTYRGSLTTPPCTEIVYWSVAEDKISISVKQYNKLVDLILRFRNPEGCGEENTGTIASPSDSTSRPPQLLNGRRVTAICPEPACSCSHKEMPKPVRPGRKPGRVVDEGKKWDSVWKNLKGPVKRDGSD